ncbi:MAG: GTP cyclohydrolase I FolE [Chitinophagaceae bacterium]|nr:GTP cyclohydrolase I FolE [Chitinophagaceae bacterium]MCW5915559.1 GTP cyclohydrolase I FolE [Chitinophagaceae bacterium]MCZ2397530.1 GTP cyclohydrolase I FolE [Chitinophagales bacterium]
MHEPGKNNFSDILNDVLPYPKINRISEDEKIEKIEYHFTEIMKTMGLDLTDDSLKDTPNRVAKMYINEIFSGLNPKNKPDITLFENKYHFSEMLVVKDIALYSNCEHHFVPIIGKAHVGYFPEKHIIGLSKINRLVQYYASRPQVQERLTVQIGEALQNILHHNDLAVVIEADHLCVASRGVKDISSQTVTSHFSGKFEDKSVRNEFLSYIRNNK